MSKSAETGIDQLRATVNVLGWCNETFNQSYTAEELIRIVVAHRKSEWDILPDQWETRQLEEAAREAKPPKWKEDERGKLIAAYESAPNPSVCAACEAMPTGTDGRAAFCSTCRKQ